jgi:methionine-rich copper-binding protein CopC
VSRLPAAAAVLAGVLLALSPAPVVSHSLLLASVPAADAVVTEAPAVALRFNNRIEKKLSQVRLVPAAGDARVLALRPDGAVDTLEAPLPPLPAGRYRIEWRVLSTDGHVVSGAFAFRVSQ